MKQLLLFCAALVFLVSLNAQPVLHAADVNPKAGDEIISANAKVTGVKIPKTGTNITWNYSKLKDTTTAPDTAHYIKPSATPYASLFPQATLAARTTSVKGFYSYYKTNSTLLETFGSAGNGDTLTWAPPYRYLSYPFTYGTDFTDTSTGTVKQGTTLTEGLRDSTEGVGYGTLKLPGGRTFTNVILAKNTTIFTIKIMGHTYITTEHSFNFFASGYHNPLLALSYNDANQVTVLNYSKNATPSFTEPAPEEESRSIANNNAALSIYPDPAVSSFTIDLSRLKSKAVAIEINDMNGRNIFTKKASIASSETIDCSAFKAGMYFVKIIYSDKTEEVQKLVINK